jgi:hypothetical protein
VNAYLAYIGTGTVSSRSAAFDALPKGQRSESFWTKLECVGVWEGVAEEVTRIRFDAPDDATAQRYAYAMAVLSGNDAVLISREAIAGEDDFTMSSARAFRVATVAAYAGENRTVAADNLIDALHAPGWAYTPDVRGDEVAYLVWADGHVSPVS